MYENSDVGVAVGAGFVCRCDGWCWGGLGCLESERRKSEPRHWSNSGMETEVMVLGLVALFASMIVRAIAAELFVPHQL